MHLYLWALRLYLNLNYRLFVITAVLLLNLRLIDFIHGIEHSYTPIQWYTNPFNLSSLDHNFVFANFILLMWFVHSCVSWEVGSSIYLTATLPRYSLLHVFFLDIYVTFKLLSLSFATVCVCVSARQDGRWGCCSWWYHHRPRQLLHRASHWSLWQ